MEVDWKAQNTPVHFQINLVENHWHKMQIFGFIISRTGINYKASPKPDFWDLALPISILLTSHLLPQQHSTAIVSHPCCPLNGVSQLLVLLCSVASSSPQYVDWLITYYLRSAKSVTCHLSCYSSQTWLWTSCLSSSTLHYPTWPGFLY